MSARYYLLEKIANPHRDLDKKTLEPMAALELLFGTLSNKLLYVLENESGRDFQAIWHSAINHLVGDGECDVPLKYLTNNEREILPFKLGRCAANIILDRNGELSHHNYLVTLVMSDGTVHVFLFDIYFIGTKTDKVSVHTTISD